MAKIRKRRKHVVSKEEKVHRKARSKKYRRAVRQAILKEEEIDAYPPKTSGMLTN